MNRRTSGNRGGCPGVAKSAMQNRAHRGPPRHRPGNLRPNSARVRAVRGGMIRRDGADPSRPLERDE